MTTANPVKRFPVRQLTKRDDHLPNYSAAFPLEPRGMGSGQLECLTSYVMRLADYHWMTTGSFMNQVLKPLMASDNTPIDPGSNRAFPFSNGYGVYATRLADSVAKATHQVGMEFLTCLPLRSVLDRMGHGLLKQHLEWCTACWQEDIALGESPYVRLAWITQPVSLCPHHLRALHSFCPHCGNHQHIFPVIPRPWICHSCGYSLMDTRPGQTLKSGPNEKRLWVAVAVDRLIFRTCSSGLMLSENSFRHALRHLLLTHGEGSYKTLARHTGMDANSFINWATGVGNPILPALLDLCYRLDVPPDKLLLDGPALTSPANWRKSKKPHFVNLVKLDGKTLASIQSALRKLIAENPSPPPLISEIAESLEVTYTVLNYHFPDEYRILKVRSTEYRKYLRTKEGLIRMEKFVESIEQLLERGIYPSERQLKQLGYVRTGDLRRPELIQKLRELQAEYSDLPIVIRNRRKKNGGMGLEIRNRQQVERGQRRKPSTRRGSRAKRQSRETGTRHS